MNTPRCDRCNNWGRIECEGAEGAGWEGSAIGFKICMAVRERWRIEDSVDWEKFKGNTDAALAAEREALRASRAYVQDGSEYVAELVTSPDFSCALFQSKELA